MHWRVEICALAGATQMAVHEEWLPGLVHWLMGVDPGGFKLNENLNVALGGCVLAMLRAWHGALASILSLLPPPPSMYLLTLVPGTCLGASVGVAIASDVLAFSCVHLLVLHRAIATLYAAYLSALYSLFNLFRGTKYNVLRQRVDSCTAYNVYMLNHQRLRRTAPSAPCSPTRRAHLDVPDPTRD